MLHSINKKAAWIPAALFVLLMAVFPAQSRTWSKNPINLAQDYLVINDNRGGGDIALVLWLAPPMIANTPATQASRDLLDKYILIGVAHAHAASDGAITFDRATTLDASDGNGNALTLLDPNTMPPTIVGALAVLQSIFGRSFGAFGQGMNWFVFDGGATHACTKGGLAVQFAGENYTYETPIPGC